MEITCPSCSATVEIDSSRVPASGLSMRCPQCSHTFQVEPSDVQQDGNSTMLGASARSENRSQRYFVKRPTGKVFGPFDENAIRMMLEANKLSGDAELSPDKQTWQGLAQIPAFAEFATDTSAGSREAAANRTMMGGWQMSDEDEAAELPQSKSSDAPLPKPKDGGAPELPRSKPPKPELPKPKSSRPELPKPKGSRPELPKPKGSRPELPKPKGSRPELPKPKGSRPELPASKSAGAGLPASKSAPELPQSKGSDSLPQAKAGDSLPQAKAGDSLPQAKAGDSLPQAKAGDSLPQAKAGDALPRSSEEEDLFGAPIDDDEEDLFGAPIDDDEEDLFGAPIEEEDEEDLFGAPVDDDEEDLFGAPVEEEDEEDLFGAPVDDDDEDLFGAPVDDDEDDLFADSIEEEEDDDDLFAAPVQDDDDDLFGAPAGPDDQGGFGDEESEDLFAAPGGDDDDLFESGGLDEDDLFSDGGGESDDFLSGDASFSFLDDEPPGSEAEDDQEDLAGQSGDWGEDLMGNTPPADEFSSDFGSSSEEEWGDDLLDDDYDNQRSIDDDDPFRPASSGPRQPASSGIPAQKTRGEAVEEDKKRGLMTMVGVPVLALLVLGGAGYALYANFVAGEETTQQEVVEDTGPITVDMQTARSGNYADLLAVIDKARNGKLAAGEKPKLLLVESLFLARYDDEKIAAHAEKVAGEYADAAESWPSLARGAWEAQGANADAARSYLEPLVGEDKPVAYYANLAMGIGDTLALERELGVGAETDAKPAAKVAEKSDASEQKAAAGVGSLDKSDDDADKAQEAANSEEESAGDEESQDQEVAENTDEADDAAEADAKQAKAEPAPNNGSAKLLAKRAVKALETASKHEPKSAAPLYWRGRLFESAGKRGKAITTWTKALELAPTHVATRVELGEAYYEQGDLNKATEVLQKVLEDYKQLASSKELSKAYHLVGRVHSARQQSEDAIKAYTQAMSIDASRTDTLRALAEEYAAAEKYQEALNFFTTNKNLGEKDAEVMLGIVRSQMGLEKWDEAIQQLEEGEKLFPNDARFPFYLGKLNRQRGAFFDAQKALQRAVEIDPELLPAHAALAQLALKVDEDVEKAEQHITKIRETPELITAAVATEVAKYYQAAENRQVAEQWYEAALERDPNYWPARLSLARMYLESGEDDRALTLLERAREEGIEDIRLSAYLADAYRQSGQYDKAIDQINKVIEQHPKNEEYIFIRGRIYFDRGNYDTAREDFNKAYEFDPRYHKAYFYVGRTAFAQEDYKKAMKIFRHVLDYKPNEGEFRYWMGRSYEAQGRLTQALEEYRKATGVDEAYALKNPELFVLRGRLLSKLGYSVQGKKDIARALELKPDMTEALIAMGDSNYRDKQYDAAIENFRQVVEDQPELPDAQYKLGMSLMYTGKELEGAKHLQDAVRYGYDDPEVFKTLGYLYKRMHKNRLAVKSFKEYLKRIAAKDQVPAATKREMIRQIEELGGSL